MLLNEIKDKKMMRMIAHLGRRETPHHKFLGGGIQGYAFLKKTRPNSVVKVYGFNSLADPYLQFIKLIINHQDNPFFPRIYRHNIFMKQPVVIITPKRNRLKYQHSGTIEMEHLRNLTTFDPEYIQRLFSYLGVDIKDDDELHDLFYSKPALYKVMKETPNDTFREALRVLARVDTDVYDLDMKNWMIRLTSVGPQLVIVDPAYADFDFDMI